MKIMAAVRFNSELQVYTDFSFNVINLDLFKALLGVIKKDPKGTG